MIDPKMMNRGSGSYGCNGSHSSGGYGSRSNGSYGSRSSGGYGSRSNGNYGSRGGRNTRSNNGCGCGNDTRTTYGQKQGMAESRLTESSACCEAKDRLKTLEFAIVDTALYLNAYPESDCALAYYHKLIEERDCLRKKINEECGPMTIYDNVSEKSWDWVEGPWPWHPDAN